MVFIGLLIVGIGCGLYKLIPPLDPSHLEKRFAAGSVGLDDDELGFKRSAINAHQGLLSLANYISVIGLYGGLGFGKSSFVRMILEKFDSKKTLLFLYLPYRNKRGEGFF